MLLFPAARLLCLLFHTANGHSNTSTIQTLCEIWTVDSSNAVGNNATLNQLLSLGVDTTDIYIVGASPRLFDVHLFEIDMTAETYSKFVPGAGIYSSHHIVTIPYALQDNVNLGVPACTTDCPTDSFDSIGYRPIRERIFLVAYNDVPPERSYISQAKMQVDGVGADLDDLKENYVADRSEGGGVTIYVIDTVSTVPHRCEESSCIGRAHNQSMRCV